MSDTAVATGLMVPDPAWAPAWHTTRKWEQSDGHRVCDFSESFMVASKGLRAGDALAMNPWQRWLLDWALERRPDGRLRYRQAVVGIRRKTGKSLIGSEVAFSPEFLDHEHPHAHLLNRLEIQVLGHVVIFMHFEQHGGPFST